MKRGLLLCMVVLLSAGVVFAQLPGGAVGVYSNDLGTSCNFTDGGGLVSFYLYHLASPGATAIEFILDLTGFTFGMHLGDTCPFLLKQGSFHTGVSIAYQACLSANVYLGVTNFLGSGSTPTCHTIFVKAHPIPSVPGALNPIAVGCPSGFLNVSGSYGKFNNDGSCACTGSVPVNESSWGQIKSLYQ